MLTRRVRPARDLTTVLLPHPVLGPIVRRVLWGEYDAGRLVRALRIAEDGSLADRHDTTAAVDPGASLGILHPAELRDELAGWAQTFADYEVLQPFPQVNRPVVTLADEQRAATSLTGFGPVPTDRVVRLLGGRWSGNGYLTAGRVHTRLARDLPGDLTLVVEISPGTTSSASDPTGYQQVTEVWLDRHWSDHWQAARVVPMGAADAAALSELLVELSAPTG